MTRLEWNNVGTRTFDTGLDRGVLYLRDDRVTPWQGLIAVEEKGSDAATAYYIDGRPFLFMPKPTEYAASIRAYTYPDEFSSVMGVIEATPGMYVDSQQADVFDLSYRTLVGNVAEGTDFAYKIHLVYNATVVPGGVSYTSMTNSIAPIEFSWDIQAVPVAIEGYRATAHVTISTKNMDPEKLSRIEDILYGTPTTQARMPSPQEVYDILTYGDTIIITDNGDGTWTAEGSYYNIYMIGDGIFEIDNVNAVDHGDGTYTISTTNA